jgi:hypothetical protein
LLVFVTDAKQERFIQTKLQAVRCFDETGWDRLGDDELVVNLASLPVGEKAVGDLERGFGTYTTSINSGDEQKPDLILASTASKLDSVAQSPFVIQLGEDDITNWQQITVAIVAGAAAGYGAAAVGGSALAVGIAGGSTGGLTWLGQVAFNVFDPDDFLGQAGWSVNAAEVAKRGVLLHDGNLNTLVPPLFRVPQNDKSSSDPQVANHPGVDAIAYDENSQIMSCANDAACGTAKRCFIGACVPTSWSDPTLPRNFTPATDIAGTTEIRNFTGSGAHYRLYVTTSVSGRDERN